MGLLCYWIFQLHIKPATLELMPGKLHELWREEGQPAPWLSWKQWVLAAIGVLLGAVTHLIWDGFTHENARGVRMLSALDDVRVAFAGRNVSWYRFLQHTSSVVGLLFVVGFVYRTISRAAEHPDSEPRLLNREQRHRWFTAYAVAACIGTIIVFFLWPHPIVWQHIGFNIARAAIASIWGIALSLIVVSFLVRREIGKERARRSSAAQRAA
jgi:hypothetical protein